MNYRERIRKAIECPQFGNERYGEWGALNLEKRILIKRLLDELDRADNYVKNLYLENQELKKKYENAVADYETTMVERNELKKQLETYEIEGYKQEDELNKMSFDIRKYKTQQKEFIKYLEDEKDRLARICNNLGEDKFDEADDILQKYKEIIGE